MRLGLSLVFTVLVSWAHAQPNSGGFGNNSFTLFCKILDTRVTLSGDIEEGVFRVKAPDVDENGREVVDRFGAKKQVIVAEGEIKRDKSKEDGLAQLDFQYKGEDVSVKFDEFIVDFMGLGAVASIDVKEGEGESKEVLCNTPKNTPITW